MPLYELHEDVARLEIDDYLELYAQLRNSPGPSEAVSIYGDNSEKVVLRFLYSPEDQKTIDSLMITRETPFFCKAYSDYKGRGGVQVQTGAVDLSHLGYGPNSTAAVRRIIALEDLGWTMPHLEEMRFDVYPTNGNHLDLRRENLSVGATAHDESGKRLLYGLPYARYKFLRVEAE